MIDVWQAVSAGLAASCVVLGLSYARCLRDERELADWLREERKRRWGLERAVCSLNPNAAALGRICAVRVGDRTLRCRVVAVGLRGSLCVRDVRNDHSGGFWVRKEKVADMVTFEEVGADA